MDIRGELMMTMKRWIDENGIKRSDPDCTDEWLFEIWAIGCDYDGRQSAEELQKLVGELVEMAQSARECLWQGKLFGVYGGDVPDKNVGKWISVKDRLPEENEYVMIWCGECQIARIEKGISEEQRKAMKRGKLDDPCETGWTLSGGYFKLKRSQSYRACDEQGNNQVPYCWYANGGPMQWFGQEVSHWAYLPQPPKGEWS